MRVMFFRLFDSKPGWLLLAACLLLGILMPGAVHAVSPPPGTLVNNTAEVRYTDENGNLHSEESNEVSTAVAGGAVLLVLKLESTDPVAIGGNITYTIHFRNSGNVAATDVVITDSLSRHLIFASASGNGVFTAGPPGSGTVTWNIGTLDAGSFGAVTITARVKTPADYAEGDPETITVGTEVPNTALIAAQEASAEALVTTTVSEGPNLVLTKLATDGTVAPDGFITYALHYENIGNREATNVLVKDSLPEGTAYVADSIQGNGSIVGRTITWHIGTVAPGGDGDVGFKVRVSPLAQDGQVIRNTGTILSTEVAGFSNTTENHVAGVATRPSLAFTKLDSPDPAYVNNPITYTLEITNDGSEELTGIVVRDPIPAHTTFVEADSGGVCIGNASSGCFEVVWQVEQLLPGETINLHLTVEIKPDTAHGAIITNSAVAYAREIPFPSPTSATTVSERTPGVIKFLNANWRPARSYRIGGIVYLQVTDADRNEDPLAVETVSIILQHEQSGDRETIILTETGPDTGVFRNSIPSTGDPAVTENQLISVAEDTTIFATYEDPLDAVPVVTDSALIDPFGVVFDSVSGAFVEGAVVTLVDDTTGGPADLSAAATGLPFDQENPVTTGADGKFQFAFVPPGTYHFAVAPPENYHFPSAVPDPELPAGFIILPASRGASFTLAAGDPDLNLDIPVDPEPGEITVRKEADKARAAIGDLVTYLITFSNVGVSPVSGVEIVDTLPAEIQYLEGSAAINDEDAADPEIASRTLTWNLSGLAPGETVRIRYVAVVGAGTPQGDAVNTVIVSGASVGMEIASNTARCTVEVSGGIFTDKAVIIGKVFVDRNGDGIQNPPAQVQTIPEESVGPDGKAGSSEQGVPGVVLYMEDGTRVETDANGKFSIQPVRPGTHVLRLDETTLPEGVSAAVGDNRFMGEAASRFIDVRAGLIHKANFPVTVDGKGGADPIIPGEDGWKEAASSGGERQDGASLEERTMEMTRDLAFIEPLEGSTVQQDQIKVLLKSPLGGLVSLYVNNMPVTDEKIGKKISNSETEVAVYEYIGVRLKAGAENILRADMKDQFGNPRGSVEIAVKSVGPPAEIIMTPDRKEIPADGKSTSRISVSVRDAQGNTLLNPGFVTLEEDYGTILTEDADPNTPGRQIRFKNGVAVALLQADFKAGEAKITALFDGIEEETTIFFTPDLRELLVVGLGEVTFGRNEESRGAFFAKGDIGKGVLMTASYDSDKDTDEDDFFRADDLNQESEEKYPILGDESEQGYEALSTDNLYLKFEKGRSSLLYGDYHTGFTENSLNAYTRTYNGLKADIVGDRISFLSFVSHSDQTQVVDAIPALGISGNYTLSRRDIIDGSELITIEVRDRFRPERILKRTPVTRYADYSIDYPAGTILFKEPVPSYDDSWNPVYIVVRYESEGDGEKFYHYGGRVAVQPVTWLEAGFTGIIEENAMDDFRMFGTDITLNLPYETVIKAEYSHTDALFGTDSLLSSKEGEGWAVNLDSKPFERLTVSAYYLHTSDYFGNMSATDAGRGREKYGVDLDYLYKPDLTLYSRFFEEKDRLNDMRYSLIAAGAEKKLGKSTAVSLEMSHEESDDDYIASDSLTTRAPFDISEETPEDLTAVKVGLRTKLRPDLTLLVNHKQQIDGSQYSLSQAGLDYQLNELNKLYLRQEYGRFDGRRETRTVFGGETKVIKNTVAFNEYRLDNGADGARNQQIVGLRNRLMLAENITGNFTIENIRTLSGQQRSDKADAFAVSAGIEYLPLETTKVTSRLEYRTETNGSDAGSWLAELGLAQELSDDYTLLVRERYQLQTGESGDETIQSRLLLGMAYRPSESDRFQGLLKTEWKHEEYEAEFGTSENTFLFSGEGVYQLDRRTQLVGKYACKFVKNNGWDSFTDLVAARVLYDLTDRIDLGAEYRFLTSHATGTHAHGGSLEAGYRLVKDLWVTLGYSLDAFDDDLVGDSHDEGVYLRFRFKFDENTLKKRGGSLVR